MVQMASCDLSHTYHKQVTNVSQHVFVILLWGMLTSPLNIHPVGVWGGCSWLSPLVTNRPSVARAADWKGDDRGDQALTKRICGFDSRLVLGPVIPKTLQMGVVSSWMVLTMKQGPRNITGQPGVSIMWLGGLACGPMTCYPSEAAL